MSSIVYDGWIEVICGPMFSGKTEELIKRLDKIKYAKKSFIVFKPVIDTRSKEQIVSRHNKAVPAIEINNANEILDYLNNIDNDYKVIAIDEVQFMDKDIVKVVKTLAKQKHHVILAGLDKNFKAEPFGSMPELLAIADSVQKLIALCNVCGSPATFTYRISKNNDSEVLVGDSDTYEARCYEHYDYEE